MTTIESIDPRTGEAVATVAEATSSAAVASRCEAAARVAPALEAAGRAARATMLEAMAEALEQRRGSLVAIAERETALGNARLDGELTRSCFQFRFFAEVLRDGGYLEAIIDHSGDSPMGPRPDLRRILRPLGPVAVFGASNFPLAFSVPGGDTASALAAGCPVVVKAHDAHPATCELAAEALLEGAREAGQPAEVIGLVFGEPAGVELVRHPAIQAVGFTGSLQGGRALAELAAARPSPIPFYGELGALNAAAVCPAAAAARGEQIGRGFAASFTLGAGQFCTKPGLLLVPEGDPGDAVRDSLAAAVVELPSAVMLSERIARGFATGSAALRQLAGVRVLAEGRASGGGGFLGRPLVLEADAAALGGPLLEECFGPVIALVRYGDTAELRALLDRFSPALTATIHADEDDEALARLLLAELGARAGRVIWNGYPTGVSVAWAMHHGGPYPATTDPLHTSVGATAIRRWMKPVCYQGVPEHLLPAELRDAPEPAHQVPRRVDGRVIVAAS